MHVHTSYGLLINHSSLLVELGTVLVPIPALRLFFLMHLLNNFTSQPFIMHLLDHFAGKNMPHAQSAAPCPFGR
jgi:hypothetical protein